MKVTLCSWCDKPAQHKTREQGAHDNADACCDSHYLQHFAKHARPMHTMDLPLRTRPTILADAGDNSWLLGYGSTQ